jgi:DNA-binding transcriptional LysR family regulator
MSDLSYAVQCLNLLSVMLTWHNQAVDLKLLKSFVTVAELSSFTEASAKLHIVQPAISRQIQQLEAEVGTALLWRTKRMVKLTAAGSLFLQNAKDLLARVEAAKQEAQRAARGQVGRLSIGYLGSATSPFLPDLVQRYRARYPGVQVSVAELTPGEQMAAFERSEIDVGFTRALDRIERTRFQELEIYTDRLVAALPSSDPRCRGKEIAVRDLALDSFVMFERSLAPGLIDNAIGVCQKAGFSPQIKAEARVMQTVLVMVAAGMGVSLMPACVSHLSVQGASLVRLTGKPIPIELVMVWPREPVRPTVAEFQTLVLERRETVRNLMMFAE